MQYSDGNASEKWAKIFPTIDECYKLKEVLLPAVRFLLLLSEHTISCRSNSLGNDDWPCVSLLKLKCLYFSELMFLAKVGVTVQLYSLVDDTLSF